MPIPPGWDADSAVAALAPQPWRGIVWRSHGLDLTASRHAGARIYYDPASDGGSRRRSGRYHRASDLFPAARVWPALYTALTDGGCLAEATRHAGSLQDLDTLRISRLRIELSAVIDLTEPARYGLTLEDVTDDFDHAVTQELGLAALERDAEGILVPPASRVGTNLVILTENLQPTSSIVALDSIDPRLYVARP